MASELEEKEKVGKGSSSTPIETSHGASTIMNGRYAFGYGQKVENENNNRRSSIDDSSSIGSGSKEGKTKKEGKGKTEGRTEVEVESVEQHNGSRGKEKRNKRRWWKLSR